MSRALSLVSFVDSVGECEHTRLFALAESLGLMEMLGDWVKNYSRLAYIDTGVGDFVRYREQTRAEAERRGWDYDEIQGNTRLLQRLLDGDWDTADFLVIPPTQTLKPTYDDDIIGLA